jgi:hypothetical protein
VQKNLFVVPGKKYNKIFSQSRETKHKLGQYWLKINCTFDVVVYL